MFFFFSSRRRHTRFDCDWSSDVCSSDLNSIRLVVAEIQPDGTYRVLDEDREMTRLGRGLAETGKLATETMEHSLQTLGRMKAIAEGFGVQDLRAIATSAVREASNGPEFCAQAWRRLRV